MQRLELNPGDVVVKQVEAYSSLVAYSVTYILHLTSEIIISLVLFFCRVVKETASTLWVVENLRSWQLRFVRQ